MDVLYLLSFFFHFSRFSFFFLFAAYWNLSLQIADHGFHVVHANSWLLLCGMPRHWPLLSWLFAVVVIVVATRPRSFRTLSHFTRLRFAHPKIYRVFECSFWNRSACGVWQLYVVVVYLYVVYVHTYVIYVPGSIGRQVNNLVF